MSSAGILQEIENVYVSHKNNISIICLHLGDSTSQFDDCGKNKLSSSLKNQFESGKKRMEK